MKTSERIQERKTKNLREKLVARFKNSISNFDFEDLEELSEYLKVWEENIEEDIEFTGDTS